ncbi:hypothetical protein [Pelotomaculum propionicicum]|uniref:hypothetical protein n=1 Tax=Pelotomaculum propionicicum TaxID=258475 RepID=UPI003BA2CCFB
MFAFTMSALIFPPATSFAAGNNHDPLHMSGSAGHNHSMDMTDHNMDETTTPEMPDMSGHNMDMPAEPKPDSDTPGAGIEEPGHGGHANSNSGTGSEKTEVNRAGLLGGFGLLNGLIIMSAVFLRKKAAPVEGGGRNER